MKRDRTPVDCQHARADHKHGTVGAYVNDGCGCDPCRAANAARMAARRKAAYLGHLHSATVSATAARRYLDALALAGWSRPMIAEHLGVNLATIRRVHERDTITRRKAALIARTHDELIGRAPSGPKRASSRAATEARKRGALPALAWDNIGDPAETPVGVQRTATRRTRPADEVVEEHAHLSGFGFSDHEIAASLGMRLVSLQRALYRAKAAA